MIAAHNWTGNSVVNTYSRINEERQTNEDVIIIYLSIKWLW